jgi:outer membrane protein
VHHLPRKALLFLLLLTLYARVAPAAEAPCTSPSPECAVVGQWEISASFGFGQRSNPVAGESDIPLVVVPQISFYGKRFFLVNLELGYTFLETERNTFNLIATPGYDRVFFHRSDPQNIFVPTSGGSFNAPNLPPGATPGRGGDGNDKGLDVEGGVQIDVGTRRTTYLIGPEWTFAYGRFSGQLNATREVTGRHDGTEVRGALAAPLFAGRFGSLVASGGFTWKSAEVVRYYYGVDGLYEPDSSLSPFVKLRYSKELSDRWALNVFAHYEKLSSSISKSPLVSDDEVTTAFAGLVFRIY